MRPLLAALLLMPVTATAQVLSPEVQRMTVAEYDDLGLFVRGEIMKPVSESAGVGYTQVNACLKKLAVHPDTRHEQMSTAVPFCIDYARTKK